MKHIQVARNIVNSDEVETWLHQTVGETYEAIWSWVGTTLRKWIIKEAPAKPIVQDALPAWLRDKMSNDAKAVVLDDDPAATTAPVSLWQNNLYGVLVERRIDWRKRRAQPAVVVVNGINW